MNSQLYGKEYKIPSNILKSIKTALYNNPNSEGTKRAKYLLNGGKMTYQMMKRIKNFFDHREYKDKIQYELAGGNLMKSFIEKKLNSERRGVEISKNVKRDVNVDVNLGVKAQQLVNLKENENTKNINSLAIIFNKDKKILLLKRSMIKEMWQPGKWALVGGGIEKDETPINACKREILEETGLVIDKLKEKTKIERNKNSVEYLFFAIYDGDDYDVTLNYEHDSFGWFTPNEIKFLNTVPNLMDYINIVIKSYN